MFFSLTTLQKNFIEKQIHTRFFLSKEVPKEITFQKNGLRLKIMRTFTENLLKVYEAQTRFVWRKRFVKTPAL